MSSPKIMIVDDDVSILTLLEKRLQKEGYQTIRATSGRDAVSKAKTFMPDLILMDIMLPDIDGAEAFRMIRENGDTKHIPVIFLSGIVDDTGNGRAQIKVENEVHPAIGKPVDFYLLLEVMREQLPGWTGEA